MQINSFSDFSLRTLMYLALNQDRLVTSKEIAASYDLSFDHIAKVAQFLTRHGYVESIRGRYGGMRLARKPDDISIGEVLRLAEAGTGLVECMRPGNKDVHCKLAKFCGLTPLLMDANEAFYKSLDNKMLSDALPKRNVFLEAFGDSLPDKE